MSMPPRPAFAPRARNSGGGPVGPAPGTAGVPGPPMAGCSLGRSAPTTTAGGREVSSTMRLMVAQCTKYECEHDGEEDDGERQPQLGERVVAPGDDQRNAHHEHPDRSRLDDALRDEFSRAKDEVAVHRLLGGLRGEDRKGDLSGRTPRSRRRHAGTEKACPSPLEFPPLLGDAGLRRYAASARVSGAHSTGIDAGSSELQLRRARR